MAALDAIQGVVMSALKSEFKPDIIIVRKGCQQFQDGFINTVRPRTYGQSDDLRELANMAIAFFENLKWTVSIGISLKIGKKALGVITSLSVLNTQVNLLFDRQGAGTAERTEGAVFTIDAADALSLFPARAVGASKTGIYGNFLNSFMVAFKKIILKGMVSFFFSVNTPLSPHRDSVFLSWQAYHEVR